MIKIIGICCILTGAFCGIAAWRMERKEKLHRMEDIIDFLRRGAEAVEQQTPIIFFLEDYECKDELLSDVVNCMAYELESNKWKSGREAWEAVIKQPFRNTGKGSGDEDHRSGTQDIIDGEYKSGVGDNVDGEYKSGAGGTDDGYKPAAKERDKGRKPQVNRWNFNEEQWEAFCAIGQIFEASGTKAALELLHSQKNKWNRFLSEERQQLAQQQKVVFPVGMLSGVMLVLLLV